MIENDSTSPDSLITGPLIDPITNNIISQTCGPELINLSSPFYGANQYFWDFMMELVLMIKIQPIFIKILNI